MREIGMASFHKLERANRSGVGDVRARASIYDHLDNLSQVQDQFDLRHTTISVLRALCSFLPSETKEEGQGRAIVWPSNEALSERANGMPERTLRRHLQKLVESGFILRKSSANGKRFALRMSGVAMVAFGFDLSPLLERSDELRHLADLQKEQTEHIAVLRARIRALIVHDDLSEDEISLAQKALRGKVTMRLLEDVLGALQKAMPDKMAARESENGRHIQNTKIESESVKRPDAYPVQKKETKDLNFGECLDAVKSCLAFADQPIGNWDMLRRLGELLAPMIGIKPDLYARAKQFMGPRDAGLAVLCVIEVQEKLRAPAAYFNTLTDRAKVGKFSLKGLVGMAARCEPSVRFAGAN